MGDFQPSSVFITDFQENLLVEEEDKIRAKVYNIGVEQYQHNTAKLGPAIAGEGQARDRGEDVGSIRRCG